MNASRPLGRSLIDTGWSSIAISVLSFFSGVILARLLEPDGRGALGHVQVWATMVSGIGALSLFEAAVVEGRQRPGEATGYLTVLLAFSTLYTIVCLIPYAALVLSGVIEPGGVDPVTSILFVGAFTLTFFVNQTFISVEQASLRFGLLALDRVITPGIYCLMLLAAFLIQSDSVPLVLAILILSRVPIIAVRVRRYMPDLAERPDWSRGWRTALLGFRFHGGTVVRLVADQIDRLIIVAIWTNTQIGLYLVAYSAAGLGYSLISQALQLVILPSVAGDDVEQRQRRLAKALRMTLLVSASICAVIVVAAPFVIPLVFGADFAPAAGFTQGMALALVLLPYQRILETATRSIGLSWPSLRMNICFVAVVLVAWIFVDFDRAIPLFAALTLARVAAVAWGLRDLRHEGIDLRIRDCFFPRWADVREMAAAGWDYAGAIRKQLNSRKSRS
jgi:O-antigen/teichoic acid export membrane protein